MRAEPPHDAHAERTFLGAVIWRSENLARYPVTAEHFHLPLHRAVLRGIETVLARGEKPDVFNVQAACEALGVRVLGSTLSEWTEEHGSAATAWPLLEKYRRRRALLVAGQKLSAAALGTSDVPGDFEQQVADGMQLLKSALVGADTLKFRQSLRDAVHDRLEQLSSPATLARQRLLTGLNAFDAIGGFPRGELTVLGARPRVGKSALAQQVAMNVARCGGRALYFSPEMSAALLADRHFAQDGTVELGRFNRGGFTGPEWSALSRVADSVPAGFILDDHDPMTSEEVVTSARHEHLSGALDLVVVDHLQYLRDQAVYRGERETQVIGRALANLKGLARALNCVVLVVSQLSRKVEERDNKRPRLEDLRESGTIEQDAFMIVMLYRAALYDAKADPRAMQLVEANVAKNRNGGEGVRELSWDGPHARFFDSREATDQQGAMTW